MNIFKRFMRSRPIKSSASAPAVDLSTKPEPADKPTTIVVEPKETKLPKQQIKMLLALQTGRKTQRELMELGVKSPTNTFTDLRKRGYAVHYYATKKEYYL